VLTGRCACGAIRFDVEDSFIYAGYCHCAECRAATGSAFSAFGGIERIKLVVASGADRIRVYERPDRERVNFCVHCGAIVFAFVRHGEFVHVPLGALLQSPAMRPSFHMCVASKAPWYEIIDALPQYPEQPPVSVFGRAANAAEPVALSPQSSRSEYSRRLQRVLDHIDQHLDEALDLEAVADVAHFSPFHFHRIFAAWMGETPADYLRGRRLDRAAEQLVTDRTASVLGVALSVGFGSGESLARAFKTRFGCTPTAWRAESASGRVKRLRSAQRRAATPDGNRGQFLRKQDQMQGTVDAQHDRSDQYFAEINMRVKVVDFPSTRVAFLRNVGPLGATVGKFWADTVFPWMAANGLSDRPRYGIGLDDPMTTEPAKLRYDACVEVPDGFVAKPPAGITVLPGGRYAVRSFKGTPATIGTAWMEVFRDWLPSSAMQMDSRPTIEYYPGGSTVDPKTGVFECELWVPVKPL
jgi:AraC family transcriptional regulator